MKPKAQARIWRGTPLNLTRLARVLQSGGLVAVPTETVYGLAANALDARACRRIFTAKGRPATDPLIVHLHSACDLALVAEPNSAALKLAERFWPGPLTLVLPKRDVVPDTVSAGLPSVAVRVPAHALFRRLLKLTGLPLAAPSANRFGAVSPTSAAHVRAGLGNKIRHILDGGDSAIGIESTIVDLRDPTRPRLLRPGAVTREQLERTLGVRVTDGRRKNAGLAAKAQIAPGLFKRHYSPDTPVVLHEKITATEIGGGTADEAWLLLARPRETGAARNVFWLEARGRLKGAARNLYRQVRAIDTLGFARLHIERARGEPSGLAAAINDRLQRAATRA